MTLVHWIQLFGLVALGISLIYIVCYEVWATHHRKVGREALLRSASHLGKRDRQDWERMVRRHDRRMRRGRGSR